jgi:hypothetical protein
VSLPEGTRRSRLAPVVSAVFAVLLLTGVLAAPAGATTNTSIGFDGLADGAVVTSQYGTSGVTFGKASDFGLSLGNNDCGPPHVKSDPADARSAPNVASAPRCSASDSSTVGTFAAFSFPRKAVSAYVGTATGVAGVKAIMIGYNSMGTFVAFTPQTLIGAGAHTLLSISRPSADIAYLAIYIEGVVGNGTPLLIDDLSLDNSAAPLSVAGTTVSAVAGTAFHGTVANIADGDLTATAGDFGVSITWGDGHSSAGSVSAAPGGGFDVSGTNTYAAVGSYPISLSLTKVNGRTATGHGTASVSTTAGAPTINVTQTHSPPQFVHGQAGNFHVVLHNGSAAGTAAISLTDNFGGSFTAGAAPVTIANQAGISCPTPVTTGAGVTCTIAGGLAGGASASFDISGAISTPPGSTAHNVVSASDLAGGGTTTASGQLDAIATTTGVVTPPAAHASFVALTAPPGRMIIDASGSRPPGARVQSYAWNIDRHSGSEPSALCGADASQLSGRLSAGTHTVNLRVTDLGGAVTSTTHQLTVLAPARDSPGAPIATRTRAHATRAAALTQVFVCSPGPSDHPGDVTAQGGPPAGCATEVQFGLADAVGCLNAITKRSDWPAAEGKIIHQLSLATHACPNCARDSRVLSVGVGNLEQALSATEDPYFSTKPVRINGIDFYPNNGASILLVPNQNYVISSDATMKLGGVPISSGLVILYVPQGVGHANKVHIDNYTLSEQAKRIGIGEFPFDGSIGLDFAYHRAQLPVHVTLPNVFTAGSGDPIHGAVTLATDNSHGLLLDAVHVDVPEAFLGLLEVDNLFFDYQREGDIWSGGADFVFPGLGLTLKASPPPPDNGFGLKGGSFDHAGATLFFNPPVYPTGLETFPGVFLKHIGFSIGLNPTRFTGNVGVNVAGIADIDGAMLLAFPSQNAPYDVPADVGAGLGPLAGSHLTSPSLAVGGDVSIVVPVLGSIGPLGEGYLLYQFPDTISLGAKFGYDLAGVFSIEGHIKGFVQVHKRNFNLEGGVHACVKYLGCTGVEALVSSNGIAACWSQSILIGHIDVGVGYHWGDSFPDIYLLGCDVGPYRATASAAPGLGAHTFALPAGLPFATVRLRGATGAPSVTLTGPHGERLVAPTGANTFFDKQFALLRQPETRTTYIGIKRPAAGTWTLTTQTGSAPITQLLSANGLPAPQIHARVLQSGAARILVYKVRAEPGQVVSFVEHGPATWRAIGNATRSSGRLRFIPGAGPLGTRTIVALISHHGIVTKQLLLASFRAPSPARPGRPARIRLSRHRQTLTISWPAAHNAQRYAVTVSLSDGRRVLILTRAAKRTVRIPNVALSLSGSVRVVGLTATNRAGRPATLRFRRLRRPSPAPHPRLHA